MPRKHRVDFFKKHGGYKVKQATDLAKAEEEALDRGWSFEWENDQDPDLSWASDEERADIKEVLVAILKDENGKVLDSLGGIVDPTNHYARVVEAEMADNVLHDLKKRGASEGGDDDAVRELVLFIDNDGDLYRQRTTPIMKNLAKKMLKGTYDSEKAVKLWKYLADDGAKKYQKEFGTEDSPIFTPAVRKAVARELSMAFEDSAKNGEFDLEKLAKGA